MKLYQAMMKDLFNKDTYLLYTDSKIRHSVLEGKFIFSIVWSLGGSADTSSRKKIEAEIKKLLSGNVPIPNYEKKKLSYPERNSLFDYNYAAKKGVPPGGAY